MSGSADLSRETEGVLRSIIARLDGFAYRCRMDDNYTMLFMAGQVAQICGRPQEDFIGNAALGFAEAIHPDDASDVDAAVDEALQRKDRWAVEYRIRRPDGGAVWVHETGGGVYNEDGSVAYLEGFIRNIAGEIATREDLRRMAEDGDRLTSDIMGHVDVILGAIRQLNILSMNARIEANRAGSAGAGFKIVAQEMHDLAERTNAAARRITELASSRG